MYLKKIVYFDYLEHGEKVKNVGHVKLLLHHDVLSLDVHLKGLYDTDSLLTDLLGIAGGKEVRLGRLCIDKGNCRYLGQFPADNLDGGGLSAEELTGLCIRVSQSRCVRAIWGETQENRIERQENTIYAAVQDETAGVEKKTGTTEPEGIKMQDGNTSASTERHGPEEFGNGKRAGETAETGPIHTEPPSMQELHAIWNAVEKKEAPEEPAESEKSEEEQPFQVQDKIYEDKVYEDKWKQLCHNYHVIHPFGEEAYIRLTPRDFVVLRQEYQQLVNNSFLLHGYYNYRHLILGRIRDEKGSSYYLGVPGTYYEREKMVAVMFGFEGFESAAENIGPGTFGYYMRRVQI